MRVLVSGAAGFLAAELIRAAPPTVELVGVTRREPPAWAAQAPGVTWVSADLAQPGCQRKLPQQLDVIVHLAQSRHDRDLPAHVDDLVDVNVGATARLLDHARAAGAQRFVLASSATVYQASAEPLDESSALDPRSIYGASKRGAELLCQAFSEHVPCSTLRLFTTYGAGQRGRLVADLIARVREGRPIVLQGRDGLLLSPIHVADVAAAFHAAMGHDRDGFELVNVGGAERLSLRQLAETIGDALGREPKLEQGDGPEPGGWVADRTRMLELLDVAEPLPFAEGIKLTLAQEELAAT